MTPRKALDNETLKIPIGKGTIGYRLLLLAGTAFLGVQQNNSIETQESIRSKLDRIEYRQDQFIKTQEKDHALIETNHYYEVAEHEKIKNTIDDLKDKYIFNNPYFKTKNN